MILFALGFEQEKRLENPGKKMVLEGGLEPP